MKRLPLIVLTISVVAVLLLLVVTFGHIKDTNGADTSLCTLTDKQILAQNLSDPDYNATFLPYHTAVGEEVILGALNLSGVYLLDEFHAEGETIIIQTQLISRLSGNLRIVLLCDGVYVRDFPLGIDERITVENANGTYEIRVAAESAILVEIRASWWAVH
jgi:hypothetical protein